MQKKLSHAENQINSLRHKVKVNFRLGVIIFFITTIIQLVSGCEPLNPDDNKKKNSQDTTPNEIIQKPEINDWEDD